MEVGSVVRAIFDFCPSVAEELTLFAGDVIEVSSVIDEFWLLGNKGGITGQFPVSFVEALTVPSMKHGERLYVCVSDFTSHEPGALSLQRGDLVVLEGSLASSWLQGRNCWGSRGFFPLSCIQEFILSSRSRKLCQNFTSDLPNYAIGQARAIMGLSAQLEEELDFREGDIITITRIPEPGWFEGELSERRGIFPEGFVELLSPLRVTDSQAVPAINNEDFQCNNRGIAQVPVESEENNKNTKEGECHEDIFAIALYKFEALEMKELDFDVGDRIKIIGTLEDGWLEGELYGKKGIFPHRFVKFEGTEKAPRQDLPAEIETDNVPYDPISYFDVSSSHVQRETDPHYWDVHLDNSLSSTTGGSQEKLENFDANPCNKEMLHDDYETINSISSKPQLPPRPQSKAYSSSSPQTPVRVSKEDLHERRGKKHLLNGAQEKWSSKKAFSLMSADEQARVQNNCAEAPKSKWKNSQRCEDVVNWVEDQRHKSKISSSSTSKYKHKSSGTWSAPLTTGRESPGEEKYTSGTELIDLDSKLSEQLSEFEKSLSNPRGNGNTKVSRHFSILDYNSETDIIRGSPQLTKPKKSPEKRRILRPPPPRPHSRASSTTYLSVKPTPHRNERTQNTSPALSFKPSRPAPLPPPCNRRNTPSPKPQPRLDTPVENILSSDVQDDGDSTDDVNTLEKERHSPCPFLLLKIEEVERELETYRKTREELGLMLEEDQDEITRAETIENLEFCDSNIESLGLELQELKDMTLLSSQPEALDESPSAASAVENSEQRMQEKRSKVLEELLQTEKDYLRDLDACVEHIMVPLQATQMGNVDFEVLFGNIHAVIDISRRLLAALENSDSAGLVFLEHRGELENVYKEYCQNHEDTIALLEAYEKDERFQKHLLDCMETMKSLYREWGRTNYINLGSFLIKPVQRIMRYPLLLMELLSATPDSHPDKSPLKEAVMTVKEINVNINEYKRRKDLVLKYRKGDEDSLIDKISKLNIHSIIKKSNRVSSHLKHLTGFAPQIKDEAFEETEKNFRMQERLIKSFIRDLSVYLQHIRESACVKVLAAMSMWDLYTDKGTSDLEKFQKAHRHISEKLFTEFKERTEKLVISPLNQLLTMFAGPHKLVQKRFDKLLDYHNCTERAEKLKDKRTLEELQSARNNYEALNAQLLDELPKFHNYAKELFASCVRGYANAHCDFVKLALEELNPLLTLLGIGSREGNLISLFQEEHNKALQQLQLFTFFPENPPPVKKPFERKTIERQSARKTIPNPSKYVQQLDDHRTALLARYPPDKLYQADRNFNAAQDLDVSVQEGDLVGVIKQQDPMGSQNRWLIDNGVTKGFVYSSFLKPYNPRRSHSDVSVGSHSSTESGYGGSSPNFSRQNSNSTLTLNHSSSSVTFTTTSSTKSSSDSTLSGSSLSNSSVTSKQAPSGANQSKGASESDPAMLPCTNDKGPGGSRENIAATDSAPQTKPAEPRRRGSQPENGHNGGDKGRVLDNPKAYRRKARSPLSVDLEEDDCESEGNQLQVYYAVYTFEARSQNELSVSANQKLKILEFRDMNGNNEWWLAEVEGRRGYVPSSYIRKTEYT
ncbi:dynamin-binding protein isoform X1 [Spea bombifrons]|uniref:dynamin-binding protein isoform X1 n=1 Tax=Spea bombifrons TaxID=233779 RepID=UPI00234A0C65|nr:dynamin-binding protein isoform X1 [Spea bombifrons]